MIRVFKSHWKVNKSYPCSTLAKIWASSNFGNTAFYKAHNSLGTCREKASVFEDFLANDGCTYIAKKNVEIRNSPEHCQRVSV